jgi:type II restriction enzyme
MDLGMDPSVAVGYKSPAQIARVVSEHWAGSNLYCVSCPAKRLYGTKANTAAFDFVCHSCESRYELKASRQWNEARVLDAAYETMMEAIASDSRPHLVVMQYSEQWMVRNLLLVPSFFFTESIIEKRKPLARSARRANWVGCNILLKSVPPEGRIRLVADGRAANVKAVRDAFRSIQPISRMQVDRRGWLLDVWRCVHELGKRRFSLLDVYAAEDALSNLHPRNRNVRPKIRQQLQVLRDLGVLRFLGRGYYEFTEPRMVV